MNIIYPDLLKQGDTIAVMSPSSYIEENDLIKACKYIQSRGYECYVHPQTLARYNQSAGTNEEKLDAFHDLVSDKNIKAVFFSTGGNRSLNWIDNIDWDLVKKNPKIYIGFSDITPITNLISANTNMVTYHGPNLRWFVAGNHNDTDANQCFDLLSGKTTQINLGDQVKNISNVKNILGQLIGGNFPNFQYLIHELDFENKILFLEDWNEEYSRTDRMLCNFKRQGVFNKISALVLGKFENMLDTGRPYGFSLDDMITEHVPEHIPVIFNAPFGHGNRLCTLPIGQTCHLNFDDNCVTLSFEND